MLGKDEPDDAPRLFRPEPAPEGGPMRRRTGLAIALITASLATMVGVALGTPGSGFTVVPIASAEFDHRFAIGQAAGQSTVVARFRFDPGGTTGWHTHPGKTVVLVTAGEFTVYRDHDGECRSRTYGPGEGFVEPSKRVHIGVNEGDSRVKLVAVFFRVPEDGTTRIDQPDPGVC
jgi:quercetin dioxygenase-like cupin family protein